MSKPMLEYIDRPFEVKSIDDDGNIEGYGSTFGGEPDAYGDVIEKGAFKDSIAEGGRNRTGIPILYQHDPAEPVGMWHEIAEDSKGLRLRGKLELELMMAKKAYILAKKKIITGLSIGFDTKNGLVEYDNQTGIRTLKKINLWEVSLVTFPANINAQVVGVKSLFNAKTPRELEHALRDSGLSRQEALYIVAMCKGALRDSGANNKKEVQKVLNTLKEVNNSLFGGEKWVME